MSEQPTPQPGQPATQPPIVSRSGGIAVRTTERGLPIQLKIAAEEMSRTPEALAREISALCRLSAIAQQVARRRELLARGISPTVIRDLKLATEAELAQAQGTPEDDEEPPQSWMRSL